MRSNAQTIMNQPQSSSKKLGQGFLAVFWLLLLVILTWSFSDKGPESAMEYSNDGDVQAGIAKIKRSRNGHYLALGEINQETVVFLVDTGATTVAVPLHIAKKIGLKLGMEMLMSTANGTSKAYATTIDSLVIGSIHLRQVRATIAPNIDGDEILLGMSALKQLEFSQSGNTLTLIDRKVVPQSR
jgi:aspartyl protease family protein